MRHALKTEPEYFNQTLEGNKLFEIRKNDRNYYPGDILLLQEYLPEKNIYTGREIEVTVNYIFYGGEFGLLSGYCVMSFVIRKIIGVEPKPVKPYVWPEEAWTGTEINMRVV